MPRLIQRVLARFQKQAFDLEAMSNLRPKTTGVEGVVIWISAGEFAGRDAQHGPRIKVVLGDTATSEGLQQAVSVRLTNPPIVLGKLPNKIRQEVLAFVDQNREVLLQHWRGELDSKEALDLIRKV